MSNTKNEVIVEVLETVADNKLIMGDHLVEIGISGPNLEATLSNVAIAQSELGHARLLYNWIQELKTGSRKKIEIKEQTGKAFASVMEVEDFISLVATLYTSNVVSDLILGAVAESELSTKTITKMVGEQKDHIIYARTWCNELINDKGQIPVKFKKVFEQARKDGADWLRSRQDDERLKELGLFDENSDVVKTFDDLMDRIVKEPAHTE